MQGNKPRIEINDGDVHVHGHDPVHGKRAVIARNVRTCKEIRTTYLNRNLDAENETEKQQFENFWQFVFFSQIFEIKKKNISSRSNQSVEL